MKKLLLMVFPLALVGCDEKPTEPVKTVDHFLEDKADREATLKVCQNNPGELRDTPNCINAVAALVKMSGGELKSVKWDVKPWKAERK